jgi:hypothetical protein
MVVDHATRLLDFHPRRHYPLFPQLCEFNKLAKALGADPDKLIPGGKWPDDEYGWLLQLSYDQEGRLIPAKTKRLQPDFSVRTGPH